MGERVNYGAGSITANYDGANKHRTVIEADVHVGSNCALVARRPWARAPRWAAAAPSPRTSLQAPGCGAGQAGGHCELAAPQNEGLL